jgi:hypothetical protein
MTGQRPIGWWVKRLDQLLEEVLDGALAADGLTRRHWQVLHALDSGGLDERHLREVLAPFGRPAEVGAALGDLVERGWVTRTGTGQLVQTEDGRVADERVGGRISQLRRAVTEGLCAEEYERTLAALERMVGNAERVLGEAGS